MKIAFLSNYFNHHQRFLSNALSEKCEYSFIETSSMTEERINLGWGVSSVPNYVKNYKAQKEECDKILEEADAIIYGSAPYSIIEKELKRGKPVFVYSERIYKKPVKWYMYPVRWVQFFKKWGRYKNAYLLCASAYTALDYAKTGTFKNKAFKWGYFPECKKYENIDSLIERKQKNSILWCARFIDWKHPESALAVAQNLKASGYEFQLNMIGVGKMQQEISNKIIELGLENEVHLLGSMKPEQVREIMEQSEVFIATSDRQEGWGAVLNEAMNSACAVVANNEMGSAPYLVENGVNGLLYYENNIEELCEKVKFLLDKYEKRIEYSKKAYETIVDEWNSEKAASRLVDLVKLQLTGNANQKMFSYGACSKAN